MSKLELIQDFLAQKRLAIVGVSRQPKDFSRALFREFCERGYDPVPVNPAVEEVDGHPCYPRVQDVHPSPAAVLLMTAPEISENVLLDCADSGVKKIWLYRASGKGGAVSAGAEEFCRSKGISVIAGECPLMFLHDSGWFHRLHGLVKKITGSYPQ